MTTIKTPKRPRTSIRRDAIHPQDYLKFDHRFSCEDCSHFRESDASCTIGYGTHWHRRAFQQKEYELTGKIAQCRFLEID